MKQYILSLAIIGAALAATPVHAQSANDIHEAQRQQQIANDPQVRAGLGLDGNSNLNSSGGSYGNTYNSSYDSSYNNGSYGYYQSYSYPYQPYAQNEVQARTARRGGNWYKYCSDQEPAWPIDRACPAYRRW